MDWISILLSVVAGLVISWVVARHFYKRSTMEVPEWAKPFVESLPDKPISDEQLVDLYHQAVMEGRLEVHPSGFIKCPECGAGSEKFEPWQAVTHQLGSIFHGYRCGDCNFELTNEQD